MSKYFVKEGCFIKFTVFLIIEFFEVVEYSEPSDV